MITEKPKFLLTGFFPWDDYTRNISGELGRKYPGREELFVHRCIFPGTINLLFPR